MVHMPVDRHSLPLLPALDSRDVTIQINRDFLPRIEPPFERFLDGRYLICRLTHKLSATAPPCCCRLEEPIVTPHVEAVIGGIWRYLLVFKLLRELPLDPAAQSQR